MDVLSKWCPPCREYLHSVLGMAVVIFKVPTAPSIESRSHMGSFSNHITRPLPRTNPVPVPVS